ncbi:MAG: bifunctional phosphopantothenoylcysteine decarboxylase/phosphopantothenate--cysteine ligase CoaBC [Proteobacteria bacterium]|nr:bifunctional phosphopantothenoylcysteine decarboxylase/phosphopantothenate--cysteine ligase CoaBC [Pseudomonadota bacterium]
MSNILLLMSGSIACDKASGLIPEWRKRGDSVRVVLTTAARQFVSETTVKDLGAEAVFTDTFAENEEMQHIDLGHWANMIILAPASANTINKLAAGIADDMLSTTMLAAYGLGKPTIIAPAMNTRMLLHPATRASLKKLHSWGYRVLETATGELACGEQGAGRLLEVDELLAEFDLVPLKTESKIISKTNGNKGQLLITVGGTREAIDSVRYIGNGSSGRTASIIADQLAAAGYRVTALCAESAIKPKLANIISFVSFADLAQQLKYQLSSQDYLAVIHPAAVSDYSVESLLDENNHPISSQGGKLSSDATMLIRLTTNPKLLSQLRGWSKNPEVKVVGFKLTDSTDLDVQLQAVNKLLQQDSIDAAVHNDLAEITAEQHRFRFYFGDNVTEYDGAYELTAGLQQWMENEL